MSKSILSLTLTAIGLAGCNQHSASPLQPEPAVIAAGEIGSRLPEFSLNDLQGREISSGDLRGKVVLIDFWATWCQKSMSTTLPRRSPEEISRPCKSFNENSGNREPISPAAITAGSG